MAASLAGLIETSGIEIDCAGVEQADLTFVQTLLAAQRSCAARDLPFALSGLTDSARAAFERAGVTPPGAMPSVLSGN